MIKLKTIVFPLLLLFVYAFVQTEKPTLYLTGDSTMAEKKEEKRPETGWGEVLPQFFNDQIKFENHARNGRSTRTFIEEGRWQKVIDSVKQGDYVMIQFGHNDQWEKKVNRYTPPEDYKKNLIKFVEDVRSKGGTPILLTPIVMRRFDESGKFYDIHRYPYLVREVAEEYDVPLIDHNKLSKGLLTELGEEKSEGLYLHLKPGESENYPEGLDDNTHFSPSGAKKMAELAVEGIKKLDIGLKSYLK